jgi:hypothetical protein
MLVIHRSPDGLEMVSRLARHHVIAEVCAVLGFIAVGVGWVAPRAGIALAIAALLVGVLGGRSLRTRFERGRVTSRSSVPLRRAVSRPLSAFTAVAIETFAEARRHRADRLVRGYAERSGEPIPTWLRPPDVPGANDALRRIVLVAQDGEPFPVTDWLAERDDLEPARLAIESLLR